MVRSFLFVPANEPLKIAKALKSEADAVIIDLEDAVARHRKGAARSSLIATYNELKENAEDKTSFENAWNERVCLRINDMFSAEWEADVLCAEGIGVSSLMLPKAESKAEIGLLAQEWSAVSALPLRLVPLIETALGVERATEIAGAHPCVSRLAFGTVDLALDLGIESGDDQTPLLYARSKLVYASAASRIPGPIDAVETAIDDYEKILARAKAAKKLGFTGKMAIHPKQLGPIREAWNDDDSDALAGARRIVEAFEVAEREGKAAVRVDGLMVDYPVYEQALRRLNRQAKES